MIQSQGDDTKIVPATEMKTPIERIRFKRPDTYKITTISQKLMHFILKTRVEKYPHSELL